MTISGPAWNEVDSTASLGDLLTAHHKTIEDSWGIVYPTAADLRGQFLDRPFPNDILRSDNGEWAVVERAGDIDRLTFLARTAGGRDAPTLLRSLALRAAHRGRGFFAFSSSPGAHDMLATAGLDAKEGYLTTLPASPPGSWIVHNGDRM